MIPYDVVRGPGQLVGGVVVATPGSTTSTTRSGVGDLTLTGAWALTHDEGSMPRIEVAAGVKAPTADKAIGTGETDYFANATLYKSLSPSLMVFGGGGYSWVGSNANYRLKDGATATAGLNYKPDQSMNVGVAYSYRAAIAQGLKAQSMVSPYLTERFSPRFGVTFYALGGLTSDSPRWGAGIRLSYFP
jgi:opacity protein-like surface antigen